MSAQARMYQRTLNERTALAVACIPYVEYPKKANLLY